MFEDYVEDAAQLIDCARKHLHDDNARESRMYYRVSVFCCFAALEGCINYVGAALKDAGGLPEHEIRFILESKLVFDADDLVWVERPDFHKIEDRLRLLLSRFVPSFEFGSSTWCHLKELKLLRDSLTHPKEADDDTGVQRYDVAVTRGFNAVIDLVDALLSGVFGKPLRQRIKELRLRV